MHRRFTVSLIVCLLVCLCSCLVVSVYAASYIEDSIGWSGGDSDAHFHSTNVKSSSSFNATYGYGLSSVTVSMCKVGSPTGVFVVEVQGTGNSYTDHPNGTVYATSGGLVIADLGTSYANVTFAFDGSYDLVVGEKYALVFYVSSGTVGDSDFPELKYDLVVAGYGGETWSYSSGDWQVGQAGEAFLFQVNSVYPAAGGGDVVSTIGDWDLFSGSVVSWLIYLVVLLLPAWFLGMFLKMGKWGFVIGLAIGAGLGYAFISGFPLWLLVLVAVGELGLAYQTVSRGD